jgi:D-3-phosphoglycerate dehydrogenase
MKRVLVIGQIHEAGLKILNDHKGLDVDLIADPGAGVPVEMIEKADAILIRYGVLSKAQIENADRLCVVSRHGVGCDNLPVDELSARGIPVTTVGPVNAVSVSEQAMAMMLSLSKKLAQYDHAVRSGNWSIRDGLATSELAGKTLLLLGFGQVGREVARRARAFDMDILIYDPFITADRASAAGVVKVDVWREVLGRVDVLSIHLPLIAETRNIIDADVLQAMKPTAILLNTARGGLVDEGALYEALCTRMAAGGAGIDTFEVEPPGLDAPLLSLPNVVVSPHSAALTEEAAMRMGTVAARNVIAGLEYRLDPELVFNRGALQERPAR